jgi:8-oxo-dGTP diphosphatase
MEPKMIFGDKVESLNYVIRKGVYAVIFNSTKEKITAIQTSRGHYFLPGGGVKNNEAPKECLRREMLEETGYEVEIGPLIGEAMRYFLSIKSEPILSDGYFYLAQMLHKVQDPIEDDHLLKWISVENIEELFIHEHHIWAVKKGLSFIS